MILCFSLAIALASFGCYVFIVYFPQRWRRFIEWENKLTLRVGLEPFIA